MQMSLSGFFTFIYPHAEPYSKVENCKLTRRVLTLLNETLKMKRKSQKCPACPKAVLLTALMAILNTLFLFVYSSESPIALRQERNLDVRCALSPRPLSFAKTFLS